MSLKQTLHAAAALLCVTSGAFAQATSQWTSTFDSKVLWQKVTPLGGLVVETKEGLHGVDVKTGKTIWTNSEAGNILEQNYSPLGSSPFLLLNTDESFSTTMVVDPLSGNTLFNSDKAGFKMLDQNFPLYESNALILTGKMEKLKEGLVMVDMSTGKQLWEKKGLDRIIAAASIDEKKCLVVTLYSIYCYDVATGKELWKAPTSKEAAQLDNTKSKKFGKFLKKVGDVASSGTDFDLRFHLNKDKSYFVIGTESEGAASNSTGSGGTVSSSSSTQSPDGKLYHISYNAYSLETGEMLWKDNREFNGRFGELIFIDDAIAILPQGGSKSKINLINYSDGTGKWGKKGRGISIKGSVEQAMMTDAGVTVVTGKAPKSYLNIYDVQTGAPRFKKPIKIKGDIISAQKVDAGFAFVTEKQANILDLSTGESLIEDPINPLVTKFIGDSLLVLEEKEGLLYLIDTKTAAMTQISKAPIEFENDEIPTKIEVRESGILLSSDQNIALVEKSGAIAYNNYFKAPKLPAWKRALVAAKAVGYAALADVSFGDTKAMASEHVIQFNERFLVRDSKTRQSRDFTFIMTNKDKKIALAQVDKNSGAVITTIDFDTDTKPAYDVDNIMSRVYYNSDSRVVEAYSF